MPVINNEGDNRLADLLEELIDNINDALDNTTPAEVVNELAGAMPKISVNVPQQPPPTVQVNVPESPQQQQPAVNVAPPQVTVTPKISLKPEIHVSPKTPEVHVSAPNVTVNPPKVTIESNCAKAWVFKVARDNAGRIETITATPK